MTTLLEDLKYYDWNKFPEEPATYEKVRILFYLCEQFGLYVHVSMDKIGYLTYDGYEFNDLIKKEMCTFSYKKQIQMVLLTCTNWIDINSQIGRWSKL